MHVETLCPEGRGIFLSLHLVSSWGHLEPYWCYRGARYACGELKTLVVLHTCPYVLYCCRAGLHTKNIDFLMLFLCVPFLIVFDVRIPGARGGRCFLGICPPKQFSLTPILRRTYAQLTPTGPLMSPPGAHQNRAACSRILRALAFRKICVTTKTITARTRHTRT